jgi:hypothetical protein
MAVTQVPENKPVVVGVDGTKMVLSPSESAQFNLLPGMDAGVLDETTGHKQNGLKAKPYPKICGGNAQRSIGLPSFLSFALGELALAISVPLNLKATFRSSESLA